MSQISLGEARVEKVSSKWGNWLKCKECGCTWKPKIGPVGHLSRFWFHCPNGCNSDIPPEYNMPWDPLGILGED